MIKLHLPLLASTLVLFAAAVTNGCGTAPRVASGVISNQFAAMGTQPEARAEIKIHFKDRVNLQAIANAGVDLFENVDSQTMTVGATVTTKTETILKRLGVDYDVVRKPGTLRALPMPAGYLTVEKVNAELTAIARQNPGFVKLVEIGKSVANRPILALNFNAHPEQSLPSIRINSGQHARELPPVELTVRLARDLAAGYGHDAAITRLVDTRDIWIIPIVNPDGRVRVEGGDAMWRKNTRPLSGNAVGVDTNRNADDHWASGDENAFADDYHGTAPFSEPETRAMRDLCARKHFKVSLDLHNFAGMILWPPGYDSSMTKDQPTFQQVGGQMAHQVGYRAGTIATTIYQTFGDFSTWEYDTYNTLAFAAELSDTYFYVPLSQAESDWTKWRPNFMYLMDVAGNAQAHFPDATKLMPQFTI